MTRTKKLLNDPLLRRLEAAFAQKIPPEQLQDEQGALRHGMEMAAYANVLPQYLRLGEWVQSLSEVAAYETALNGLPREFKEQYGEQLEACRGDLAEYRTKHNRHAAGGPQSFLKRHGLSKGRQNGSPGGGLG